jgi:DNA-binding transcriptional MocR family regulator
MIKKTESTNHHLYEHVAHQVMSLIEQGILRPGERIPSVRKFSLQHNVSISTVMQAYYLLEDRGLIEARPQSGYYVRNCFRELPPEPQISHPPLSASHVRIGDLFMKIFETFNRPDIIQLGVASPHPELLPSKRLNRTLGAILRRGDHAGNSYGEVMGHRQLRHQISRRALDWGCHFSDNDLLITFGCAEAVNLCLRAVAKPGDTIAVESPTYFGLLQIIENLNMKALEIATDPKEGISPEALEAAIRKHKMKACLLMPTFHNPLGSFMPEENKRRLIKLLSQHEIPLIEDDVYGDLYHGAARPKPMKAYDKHGLVLLCSSFSKTLSPGYRVGWTAPGRFKAQVLRLKISNTVSTATLPQMAIAELLQNSGYDHYLRKIRKAYAAQVQLTTQAIKKYFPEGTKVTRPTGGFLLWVELPLSVDAMTLYQKALAEKISIVPGHLFSAKQQYRNFVRLSCGQPWSAELERGLATLGELAKDCLMMNHQAKR